MAMIHLNNIVSKLKAGLCPQLPNETTTTKYLRQDGTWAVPPDNNDTYPKAVKNITRSATTFTATCYDGTTFTFTQQDNNTTYSAGTGINLSGTTFSNKYAKTVLYNNASGNTGTVTLSQSAANFNHIRIFYAEHDDGTPLPQHSIDVYSPNNARVHLSQAMRFSSGNLWVFTKSFGINGTTMMVVSGWNGAGYFANGPVAWTSGNNYIAVIRVEGWNE